jgi:serine/threonine protein kinase
LFDKTLKESWRYQPPEVLRSGSQATIAGDVYAYGVLLFVMAAAGCFGEYKLPFGAKGICCFDVLVF